MEDITTNGTLQNEEIDTLQTTLLLLFSLVFHDAALDVEHGHLNDAFDSSQQVYVVLKRVSLAELHVSINAWPADHGGQEPSLLTLFAVADREVILNAPADVDSMDNRVLAEADVGKLLEPLRGGVFDLLGYIRWEPDQKDLSNRSSQGCVWVGSQVDMFCEVVTAEDFGEIRDNVLPKSECSWSAMSTLGRLHGLGDTYSSANFWCSSTEAKSKKPQRLAGFSTSVPQNTL